MKAAVIARVSRLKWYAIIWGVLNVAVCAAFALIYREPIEFVKHLYDGLIAYFVHFFALLIYFMDSLHRTASPLITCRLKNRYCALALEIKTVAIGCLAYLAIKTAAEIAFLLVVGVGGGAFAFAFISSLVSELGAMMFLGALTMLLLKLTGNGAVTACVLVALMGLDLMGAQGMYIFNLRLFCVYFMMPRVFLILQDGTWLMQNLLRVAVLDAVAFALLPAVVWLRSRPHRAVFKLTGLLKCASGLIVAGGLALLCTDRLHWAQYDAAAYLAAACGGPSSWDGLDIRGVLAYFMIFFVQILLFGNIMRDDYDTACAYVFTRYGSRVKWLFSRVGRICAFSALYYLFVIAGVAVVGVAMGYAVNPAAMASVAGLAMVTLAACNTLLTVLTNLLSLKSRGVGAVAGVLCVYGGFLMAFPALSVTPWVLKAFPVTRGMLIMHDLSALGPLPVFSLMPLKLSVAWSVAYLAALFALTLGIGSIWIKRTSLMGK